MPAWSSTQSRMAMKQIILAMIVITVMCSVVMAARGNAKKYKQVLRKEKELKKEQNEATQVLEKIVFQEQKCYRDRKCKGDVLSNRDKHNCKVKTGGKSWRDYLGNCFSPILLFDINQAEIMATQKCYSAKNCKGKVLSNRDAHNCKVKSRGKSWRDRDGKCHTPPMFMLD